MQCVDRHNKIQENLAAGSAGSEISFIEFEDNFNSLSPLSVRNNGFLTAHYLGLQPEAYWK